MSTQSLTINNHHIRFSEDWKTGIGGGLWTTGLAMAYYFADHVPSIRKQLLKLRRRCCRRRQNEKSSSSPSITALELGSGNGFLSLCFMAVCHDLISNLAVTDLNDHLNLIHKTFDENDAILKDKVTITEYQWGSSPASTDENETTTTTSPPAVADVNKRKYDFVFGSDVAYRDELIDPLLTTLDHVSHDNTLILIGCTMIDTNVRFFDELRRRGFVYRRLSDELLRESFRGPSFGIFAIQRER